MFLKCTLLLCLILIVDSQLNDIMKEKVVRVQKFVNCPGTEQKLPLYFKDIQLHHVKRYTYVSLKYVSKIDFTEGYKVRLQIKRCVSRDALDTCEEYQNLFINRLCPIISAKNTPWSNFVDAIDPPSTCPMKKGIYTIKNCTFDSSSFSNLPLSGWYWIVQSNVYGEKTDKLVQCAITEVQFVYV